MADDLGVDNHDDFDDEPDAPLTRLPTFSLLFAALLPVLYPLAAALVGACDWLRGPRLAVPGGLLVVAIDGAIFAAAVLLALFWPMAEIVLPGLAGRPRAVRIAGGAAFVAVPLCSFAYYLGTFRDPSDWLEVLTAVLPMAVLSTIAVERTGRTMTVGALFALAVFLPLFVLNDLMGPFRVLVSYASNSATFYLLRAAVPVMAFLVGIGALLRTESPWRRLDALTRSLVWLLPTTLVFQLVPAWLHARHEGEALRWSPWDFLWVAIPGIVLCLRRPTTSGYRGALLLVATVAVLSAVMIASVLTHGEVDAIAVGRIIQGSLSLGLFSVLLVLFFTPVVRARFVDSR